MKKDFYTGLCFISAEPVCLYVQPHNPLYKKYLKTHTVDFLIQIVFY